ncbi:MAG: hypothetical protein JW734_08085 [Candidatus Omnitrophica bacterium]|nr:hypothetical protein [Candidatus Omnitrophota bacterium]
MENKKRFFRKAAFISVAVWLVFIAGISPAEEDWKTRKSFHFIVYYKNTSHKFLDRLVNKAEDCYRTITQGLGFYRDEPWVWDKRAFIYVFDTKYDYIEYTKMPEWSSGCARPDKKTIFTYSESYDFFKYVLTHELTHIILGDFLQEGRLPLWFDEGVAVYMERKNEANHLIKNIKAAIKQELFISFDKLFCLEFKDLDSKRDPQEQLTGVDYVQIFYLQSFSIVYFLFEEYDRYKFVQLLRKIKEGDKFDDAFFKTYRVFKDTEGLQRQWREFYR